VNSEKSSLSCVSGVYLDVAWNTVAETKAFTAQAKATLTDAEVSALITMLAKDPTCGDVIRGTGGLRKVRVGVHGRGKRGGARVIYYFYNETMPLFLLAVFAKNEKEDLSAAERASLTRVAEAIRTEYGRGQ
jgi:hypothetical protein